MRKVIVKPAGYPLHMNSYVDWNYVEASLYTLIDNFNDCLITNKEFCECFMTIHPFLDGNGRTYSLNKLKIVQKRSQARSKK